MLALQNDAVSNDAVPGSVPAATPTDVTVTELLFARAGDDHVGLRFEDESWTWAEHVQLSADRARWLQSVRRPGPFNVGVLLDNVPEFSFLLGAAALSGAAIVGLNPTRRGDEFAATSTSPTAS